MKYLTPSRVALGVLLAGAASVLVVACTTPVSGEFKFKSGSISAEGSVTANGGNANLGGSLPPGKCLKIEYRGSHGELLGTVTTPVPGSSQIPPGTASESHSEVDCPEDIADLPSGPGGVRAGHPYQYGTWIDIWGSPLIPDLTDGGIYKNAVYHFRVLSSSGVDPFSRIEPILRGGPGTLVPSDVEVIEFTQFVPDSLGGRMLAADTEPIDQFRLDWNGQSGYADLASDTNVVAYETSNQWHVIESIVSMQDLHSLPGQSNSGRTTRKTSSDPAPQISSASFTVVSY